MALKKKYISIYSTNSNILSTLSNLMGLSKNTTQIMMIKNGTCCVLQQRHRDISLRFEQFTKIRGWRNR